MPYSIVVVVFLAALFFTTVKVLNEYERGVMFTLGRFTGIKGPGLILVAPMVQQMRKVDLRVIVLDVPKQDVISRETFRSRSTPSSTSASSIPARPSFRSPTS